MAVVRANYVKCNENERAKAKANIRYMQNRPGRDKEQRTRPLFGAAGYLSRYEGYQFIKDAPEGTYFYRVKLSPDPVGEDTRRDVHMQKLTRYLMRNLEKRLNTAIPWAAALHDDHTDICHVHILATLPRTLNKYELELLIKDATRLCEQQRRFLDRGMSRLPWHEPPSPQSLKTGKYTASLSADRRDDSNFLLPQRQQREMARQFERAALKHYYDSRRPVSWDYRFLDPPPRYGGQGHTSCACPRCHFPQIHDRRGIHSCPSCGFLLHKKHALTLQRRKGVGWERSR